MGTSFQSTITNERFRACVDATCKTRNVIYLMECARRQKQYVGETENPLHLRMNGHRPGYYWKLPDKPMLVHFNTSGHTFEDLTVMVIQQLGSAPTKWRKLRESFWIHTLRSVAPQGLNFETDIIEDCRNIIRSVGMAFLYHPMKKCNSQLTNSI